MYKALCTAHALAGRPTRVQMDVQSTPSQCGCMGERECKYRHIDAGFAVLCSLFGSPLDSIHVHTQSRCPASSQQHHGHLAVQRETRCSVKRRQGAGQGSAGNDASWSPQPEPSRTAACAWGCDGARRMVLAWRQVVGDDLPLSLAWARNEIKSSRCPDLLSALCLRLHSSPRCRLPHK